MAHSKSENALKLVSLSDCHGSQRFEERETHNDSRFFFSERERERVYVRVRIEYVSSTYRI